MKKLLFTVFISMLFACALQVAPSGGEKDEYPPRILQESPPSSTTSFDTDEIEISFDEFVKLERLKEQLVVSPPLKYNLNASIRGKKLRLNIKDTLKESTTYVFNFGDAIVDLHEGNPIENYTYVLSTGNSIDSGRIAGKVIDAFIAEPAKSIAVMAYTIGEEDPDSLPYLRKPDYVAVTNEEGRFQLDYMKDGDYKIFALKDENNNYLFDKKTENIAFIDEMVSSNMGVDSLELYLFEEDHEEQYLKEQEELGPLSRLIFNLEVDSFSYSLELADTLGVEVLLEEYDLPSDSILLWWGEKKARFPFIVYADTLTDTLKLAIDTIKKRKRSPLRIEKFGPHRYYGPPRIEFNYPINEVDTSLIHLFDKDSVELDFSIESSEKATILRFLYDQEEKASYRLTFDSAAFKDIYGHSTDSTGYNFTLDEESDYGSLAVNIKQEYKGPLILQLTTGQRKFIKGVLLSEPFYQFEHLPSGTFSLKLILDENGNGKWDTGDYMESIQPEKVINYEGEIRIRNRWAKEVDWVIVD